MKKIAKYILNILLWLVCSIPVVTVCASTVAMHFVNFKLVNDTEINVGKEFFKSFKQNFAQSIPVLLVNGAFMGVVGYLWYLNLSPEGGKSPLMIGFLIAASLFAVMLESFSTYLLAKFDNRTGRILLLSIYCATKHIDVGVKISVLAAVTLGVPVLTVIVNPMALTYIIGAVLLFILVIVYQMLTARWITPVFDSLIKAQEEAQATHEE